MTLRLLGTGAADGWPNPFCTCASCAGERAAGRSRAQSAALLDDLVLLDCSPSTPLAAERCGASLAGVRLLLWTHQHSDHFSPATLMYRSWVNTGPLTVAGPPDVVDAARHWLPAEADVEFVALRPGDRLERHGCRVVALPAAHRTGLGDGEPEALLFDVTGPSGTRVLYATDTGPLPAAAVQACAGVGFDVVVLEESFGDRLDHGTQHLDLATFPDQLRRLREVGGIGPDTHVVATHLSHHNPPTPELARRLADWGAHVHDDGHVVVPGPEPERAHRTLVLGGARSGKSREAERCLADAPDVVYVATSYPVDGADPEWTDRVSRHRAQRPDRWRTLETLDLVALLEQPGPPLLVDCLTLWLTRVMDAHDAWNDAAWAGGAEQAVTEEVAALVTAWRTTPRRVVAVSNEVGQGMVPGTAALRRFRDAMGRLNAALAAETEDVRLVSAGRVQTL